MISFHCDVCKQICAACGRPCVLIERNSTMVRDGLWLRGLKIMLWDDAEAGSGRYHHVHLDKCLPQWIEKNAQDLQNVLDVGGPQLQKRSARK
jgi:hypothetical protein